MKKNLLLLGIIMMMFTLLRGCGSNSDLNTTLSQGDIGIATGKTEYAYGKEVKFYVQNNTQTEITITSDCPYEYLDVFEYKNNAGTFFGFGNYNTHSDYKDYPACTISARN